MIDLEFIERLIKVLDESGVDSLDIERGGTRIRLSKTPPAVSSSVGFAAPSVAAVPTHDAGQTPAVSAAEGDVSATSEPRSAPPASDLLEITAPMVGTFYQSPAPDAPAYVEPGSRVRPGDTVCIIEAMKLMNELECEISGTVVEVCVENAQPVEFGQVLFRVDPA